MPHYNKINHKQTTNFWAIDKCNYIQQPQRVLLHLSTRLNQSNTGTQEWILHVQYIQSWLTVYSVAYVFISVLLIVHRRKMKPKQQSKQRKGSTKRAVYGPLMLFRKTNIIFLNSLLTVIKINTNERAVKQLVRRSMFSLLTTHPAGTQVWNVW